MWSARRQRSRTRRAVSDAHCALQAAEGLCLCRRAAEEQLRQDFEDRIARPGRRAANSGEDSSMADIVLAIGTSHSPLLEQPGRGLSQARRHRRLRPQAARQERQALHLRRTAGEGRSLDQAADRARRCSNERAARCTANIERLSRELADARLDALIIIGDDQHEQFFDDNMPAILIYWGETIENNPLHMDEDAPQFWRKARSQYHEAAQSRDYPVDAKLGLHLIEQPDRTRASTSASPSGSPRSTARATPSASCTGA